MCLCIELLGCIKLSLSVGQVRREKISERMKFLQDLVPGCSKVVHGICVLFFLDHIHCFAKWIFHAAHLNRGLCLQVTGKAVMLDEIINYV